MQDLNNHNGKTLKTRTLGLALAMTLASAGLAAADGGGHAYSRTGASGHVEIVKSVPGGVITVGATIGDPRPVVVQERRVVIVERPEPRRVVVVRDQCPRQVVVVETKDHGRHHDRRHVVIERRVVEKRVIRDVHCDNGRGHGHGRKAAIHDGKGRDRHHHNHGRWNDRRMYARN